VSAPAVGVGKPVLRIRGSTYPVLLPSLRDPRLHLAAVIISLHVLGQVAFDFRLSIAQILISLGTAAVLELAITFRRQKVIMWPASALLTGNGVAFILRVPGTEHGDWWSTRGWWIFAGTSAVSLLSKYVIQWRGHHVFNPSNFGLVLCFLLLGPELADPLDFWWGPMSPAMALALAIIVAGGLAILLRLKLLSIAIAFWVTFAACLAVLAATGHAMTARWHLGPVTDWEFWVVLAFSPEILVFLFFMITDPKTIPAGRTGRLVYSVSIGLLAALLIAPQTTEFASKVAVLGALAIVCAARPVVEWLARRRGLQGGVARLPRLGVGLAAVAGAAAFAGALVVAGIPARPVEASTAPPPSAALDVTLGESEGLAPLGLPAARRIARDLVADLRIESDALRRRDRDRAAAGAEGARLASLWRDIGAATGGPIVVPEYRLDSVEVSLRPGEGQEQPVVLAHARGTVELVTYAGSPPAVQRRERPVPFARTFELEANGGRYLIARVQGEAAAPSGAAPVVEAFRLDDVAASVGLDFRHAAFRFGMSDDTTAMMGGGLCWLDYDADGWLDLFVVNSYSEADIVDWQERGGLPRSALFHNVGGRFEDASRGSSADLPLRGNGCVSGDFNLDGHADLYVTTGGYNVATDGYDALLWGNGDGTFTEGAAAAGVDEPGWHAGAAAGDVNGDGLPDLFVAGYTDRNAPIPGSADGFPSSHLGVRDLLYVNLGPDAEGRSRFREVGREVGLERGRLEHGLGAVFTDADGDGRLDLYVANDEDPNRLYLNVPDSGPLGFRLEERARREGVADPNAGMGIAAGDYDRDGRGDVFVTNSRNQLHAAFRGSPGPRLYEDARPAFAEAVGTTYTGWGVSWADLDLDADLDLVFANGAIPLLHPRRDAQRLQVLENLGAGGFASRDPGWTRRVNGRGLAAADYDNDGDLDVALNSIGDRLVLLRATAPRGHWLQVKLPRFAPGTTVTAVLPGGRRLVREVHAGSSYLSSEDPRVHFGLGTANRVRELLVRAPGGQETRLENVRADRLVELP
jgi:Na+-translocating ferredoxin:NAD+ oxidoreductase RnfD subunit